MVVSRDRDIEMHFYMLKGYSFADIASIFNISRERVRQIFKDRFGITRKEKAGIQYKLRNFP